MDLEQLLSTPAITAAIITGIVAFLAALIQFFIFSIKHAFEKKSNFELLLKDRLEKAYSPLVMRFNMINGTKLSTNTEIIDILSKYSHLLSDQLIKDIIDLIKMEQVDNQSKNSDDYIVEYKNVKNNISKLLEKEFFDLQEKFNRNFFEIELRSFMPWYKKIGIMIKKFCIGITLLFYALLALLLLLAKIVPSPPLFEDKFLNVIIPLIFIIILTTSMFSLGYIIDVIGLLYKKNKKRFMNYEIVPITGIYRCNICGKRNVKFYKGSRFSSCKDHKFGDKIKSIFKLYSWIIDEDLKSKITRKSLKHRNKGISSNDAIIEKAKKKTL